MLYALIPNLFMALRFTVFLAVLLLLDFYVYHGLKSVYFTRDAGVRGFTWIYWGIAFTILLLLAMAFLTGWSTWPKILRTYSFAVVAIAIITQLVFSSFLLVDDAIRLVRWTVAAISGFFSPPTDSNSLQVSRLGFLIKLGTFVSAIPLVSLVYGMTGNTSKFHIRRLSLRFPALPPSFDGLRIVHISDLHVGSFLSTEPIRRAVDLIQSQKPDLIVFTGDLVNNLSDEVIEHMDALSSLQAPHGVYSVLGNHDYGDYHPWESEEARLKNLDRLKSLQRSMGWKLLLNEHVYIERNDQRIGLVGVENWSARLNFKRYGDLKKATAGFEPASVNVLLSHDPSHWKAEVLEHYPYLHLMLSGHTHGFQFGIDIPGFRWSPVQYVYREWADLYESTGQRLYVNRGLGFLGYPGRVGILPEITVFELSCS